MALCLCICCSTTLERWGGTCAHPATGRPWALKACPRWCQCHGVSPVFHGFSYKGLKGSWKMGWKTLEKPAHLRIGATWFPEGAPKTPSLAAKVKTAFAVTSSVMC